MDVDWLIDVVGFVAFGTLWRDGRVHKQTNPIVPTPPQSAGGLRQLYAAIEFRSVHASAFLRKHICTVDDGGCDTPRPRGRSDSPVRLSYCWAGSADQYG